MLTQVRKRGAGKLQCPPGSGWTGALAGTEPHLGHDLFSRSGRFGQVHKCEEKATGLKLAAKIIKTRGVKDKVRPTRCGHGGLPSAQC